MNRNDNKIKKVWKGKGGGKRGFTEPLERSIASWLVGPSKKGKAVNQGSFRQSG
jgi:hypothetical protein